MKTFKPTTKLPKSSFAITALCALLLTSACGKNMHIGVLSQQEKTQMAADKAAALAAKAADVGVLAPLLPADITAINATLPYTNTDSNVISIGAPKLTRATKSGSAYGYVKNSNFVFKASISVPAKNPATLQSMIMTLEMDASNVYVAGKPSLKDASGNATPFTLAGQTLCVQGGTTPTCSGEAMDPNLLAASTGVQATAGADSLLASDAFKSLTFDNPVFLPLKDSTTGEGLVFNNAKEPFEIDVLEMFAISDKSSSEQIDWMMAHSAPVVGSTDPTLREFTFSISNNFYAGSGKLIVASITTAAAVAAQGADGSTAVVAVPAAPAVATSVPLITPANVPAAPVVAPATPAVVPAAPVVAPATPAVVPAAPVVAPTTPAVAPITTALAPASSAIASAATAIAPTSNAANSATSTVKKPMDPATTALVKAIIDEALGEAGYSTLETGAKATVAPAVAPVAPESAPATGDTGPKDTASSSNAGNNAGDASGSSDDF
jgi:hypothetical protein